jgi:hypothetical protein
MFCGNCGTQIPDEANFCWKCGKSVTEGVTTEAAEVRWESAEIGYEHVSPKSALDYFLNKYHGYFTAKAIGLNGVYDAGKTPTFITPRGEPDSHDYEAVQSVNNLIAQLARDGWEPVETKGSQWYNYKFRRRAKA